MSDDDGQFLVDNEGQFRNLQHAVEIMTAYTADGFDKAPSETRLPMDLMRMVVEEISAASANPLDIVKGVGGEIGVLVNGFATLTGAVLCELGEATGKKPSAILESYGNMAAQALAEIDRRRNPGEG